MISCIAFKETPFKIIVVCTSIYLLNITSNKISFYPANRNIFIYLLCYLPSYLLQFISNITSNKNTFSVANIKVFKGTPSVTGIQLLLSCLCTEIVNHLPCCLQRNIFLYHKYTGISFYLLHLCFPLLKAEIYKLFFYLCRLPKFY